EVLVERGFIVREGENYSTVEMAISAGETVWMDWEVHKKTCSLSPGAAAHANLVEATLRALTEILTGAIPATDVMFPNSTLALIEGIYKDNPVADYFNDALSAMVVGVIEERRKQDPSTRLRILEVGAGIGSTSERVLARLKAYEANVAEYCYTDVSRVF